MIAMTQPAKRSSRADCQRLIPTISTIVISTALAITALTNLVLTPIRSKDGLPKTSVPVRSLSKMGHFFAIRVVTHFPRECRKICAVE